MTIDYTSDDSQMYGLYKEGLEHLNTKASTGMDQFTPKLQRRGNPNTRLSYASYFEEDETCRKFAFPNEKPTQGWEEYEVPCENNKTSRAKTLF